MNTRTILLGSTILASLVGLGFLAHHLMQDDEKDSEEQKESTESKTPKPQVQVKPKPKPPVPKKIREIPEPAPVRHRPIARPPEPIIPRTLVKPVGLSLKSPVPVNQKSRQIEKSVRPVQKEISVETPVLDDSFPLKKGSKGPKVERLNVWLTRNHSWTGKITDQFDDQTEYKLRRLTRNTEVDEKTFNRMKMGRPVFEQKIVR